MNFLILNFKFLILAAALALVSQLAFGQPPLPPEGLPAPKFKKPASTHAVTIKPAALLNAKPKPPAKPVQFIAISRGPSPYDEMANVETVLVGTVQLDNTVKWQIEQHGRTNTFIATNTGGAHFFKEAFEITTNL